MQCAYSAEISKGIMLYQLCNSDKLNCLCINFKVERFN